MSIQLLKWPELGKKELIAYYNEIKLNKILDIGWKNPGRIDVQAYTLFHEKKQNTHAQRKVSDSESVNEIAKENENASNESLSQTDDKFDMFDEFAAEETEKDGEPFNLRLTHRKRSTEVKVASMDKILFDMRKNIKFDTEQNLVNIENIKETDDFTMDVDLVNEEIISVSFDKSENFIKENIKIDLNKYKEAMFGSNKIETPPEKLSENFGQEKLYVIENVEKSTRIHTLNCVETLVEYNNDDCHFKLAETCFSDAFKEDSVEETVYKLMIEILNTHFS